jgi:CheY-like chemotaxis protein
MARGVHYCLGTRCAEQPEVTAHAMSYRYRATSTSLSSPRADLGRGDEHGVSLDTQLDPRTRQENLPANTRSPMHKSVLIVDDDQGIREIFAEALRLAGYSVHTAANGKAALDLLATLEPPCLILLDMMMPIMNGEEFRRQQLADPILSTIPVVVITAAQDSEEKARKLDAEEGLAKPIQFDTLSAVARRFCGVASGLNDWTSDKRKT